MVAGPDPGLDPDLGAVGATAVAVEAEAHPLRLTLRTAAVVAGVGVGGRGPGHTPRAVGHRIHLEAVAVVVGAEAAAGDEVGAGVEATVAADPGHHRLVHIPHVVEVPVLVGLDLDPGLGLGLAMTANEERMARGMMNLYRGRKKVGSEANLAPNRRTERTVGVAAAVVETNHVRTLVILAGVGPTLALDRGHAAPILIARGAGLIRHHQRKIPRRRTGSVELCRDQQALRHLVDGTKRERGGEDPDRTLLQAAADLDPDRTPLPVAAGRVLDPALDRVLK